MSTPTQSPDSADPDWPVSAVPQRWVEALFDAMAGNYGARFADLWRGTDIAKVKRNWGIEIAKLSRDQLKAGRENLTLLLKAPTCPEFIAHCRQCRTEQAAAAAPRMADMRPADVAIVETNLAQMRAAQRRLLSPEPTAEWAFRLVVNGKANNGATLTSEATRCVTDTITSPAGLRVIENCIDPDLKRQYAEIRETIIENYRMRGQQLWSLQ